MLIIREESDLIKVATFPAEAAKLNVLLANSLKREVNELVNSGCQNLVLDFEAVKFIDSSGFGALVAIYNNAQNIGANLMMVNFSAITMSLLKITKLDKVFDIYTDVKTAVDSVI